MKRAWDQTGWRRDGRISSQPPPACGAGCGARESLNDADKDAWRGAQRILEINTLNEVTKPVVEAARESLVIGQS